MVEASALAAAGVLEASQRLGHRAHVERIGAVRGGERLQGFRSAIQVAQHGGLQILRADIQGVGIDRAVDEIEGGRHVAARRGDLRQRVVAGGLPRLAPGGFVELQ